MTLIIGLSVVAALLAIGGYQLIVRKYYWGAGGPPKEETKAKIDDKD